MAKKDIIGAVNAAIPGLDLPEDTNLTVEQLKAVQSALKSREEAASEALASAKEAMDAMAAAESAASAAVADAGGTPVVKISGKSYKVLGGVRHKGQVISREDLVKNSELLEQLVENGSGIVQPVKA